MNISKLGTIIGMGFNKDVIKDLFGVYRVYKKDASFTLRKYIKMMLRMLKGEKLVKHDGKYIISTFMPPIPSKAFMTNAVAVDDMKKVFTKQITADRTAPISMYLCLTSKCPNNCVYCSSKNRQGGDELTTDQWIHTIQGLQDMNTSIIGLTGGEPMVREDIYDIVRAIDDRSISILFTSGFNMTKEKAKKLKESGLFGIGISLDSFDKEVHNQNRNDDKAFDYALKAMEICREVGLYTMAQTVILKEHIDEEKLMKLFHLAGTSGAHEVKILEPILTGHLLDSKNLDKILYKETDRKKLVAIQHKANDIKSLPKITSFAYTESKEKFGCGAGSQHSYISAEGHLYPCDFVPMNFGNVKEEGIDTLWKTMNRTIGNPKIGCFAQKINKKVYLEAKGQLPLDKETSSALCKKHQSQTMPDYYVM